MARSVQPNLAEHAGVATSPPQAPGASQRRCISARYRRRMVVPVALRRAGGRTVGRRNLEAALREAPPPSPVPTAPVLQPAGTPDHQWDTGYENADTVNVRFVLPAAAFQPANGGDLKLTDLPIIRDELSDDGESVEAVATASSTTLLPRSLCCPITLLPFVKPVSTPDGHSYEKRAIRKWLRTSILSPMTGARMPSGRLVHNHALRAVLAELHAP